MNSNNTSTSYFSVPNIQKPDSTLPRGVYRDKNVDHHTDNTQQFLLLFPFLKDNFDMLEKKINDLRVNSNNIVHINRLLNYNLSCPIDAIVEIDDDGFIARTHDLPLYGYGEEPIEAIHNLKYEIESLYNDLMEDDNFTEDWLKIKLFLKGIVKDNL